MKTASKKPVFTISVLYIFISVLVYFSAYFLPVKVVKTANANSGPSHWSGVTASGAVFTGENCPVEVESEVLTFNVPQFINHGSSKQEMLNYSAGYSAEYTFKNPTQNEISATLAFPLGNKSDMGYYEDGDYVYVDDLLADKYGVLVNGEKIEAESRHTYHVYGDFDFEKESARLCDGYRQHDFFSRDTNVNYYTVKITSDETDYFYAEATIKDGGALRYGGSYGTLEKNGKDVIISFWVKSGEEITLLVFGGEIDTQTVEWRFYERSGYLNMIEKRVEAQAEFLDKSEAKTFETYVFGGYSGVNELSEVEKADFYNAVLDYIDENRQDSMLPESFSYLHESSYFMQWLVYDLHFSAGQTIKNTVTAPLFSGGLYKYTPYVYTYEYLLSPAQKWNGFKSIEIRINTPYYVINSSVEFEKTDFGYVYNSTSLPSGELEFEMCEVENPEHDNSGTALVISMIVLTVIVCVVPVVIIIAIIVAVVIFAMRYKKKKKEGDAAKQSGSFKPLNTFDKNDNNAQE